MPSLKELLNTESLKSGGSYLSDLADTIVNLPTNLQRVVTHPQIFNKIVGYNPLQRETGFAAAATGLPPKQEYAGGILNPPNLEYEKGYEFGEPVAIAAGAAPFAIPIGRSAGKALAPKMYQMAEDYMVKTGGIIPITAWHGTPHTIQGKFDISKVGTGEGNQTFSHGMYFAENPKVAKQYQASLSDTKYKVGERELKGNEAWAAQFLHDFQDDALPKRIDAETAIKKANEILKDTDTKQEIINNIKKLDKSGLSVENGNLYKVDIPDKYLPNMLHWDKPLTEQTPSVKKALESLGINTNKQKLNEFDNALLEALTGNEQIILPKQPSNPLGSEIYERLLKGNPASKSAKLNELGIKGVSYLDEGSRGWRMLTPEESTSGKYVVGKWPGGGPEQQYFDNLQEAQDYLKKNQTRNFVVFDPSEVKILEKNGQNVLKDMLVK